MITIQKMLDATRARQLEWDPEGKINDDLLFRAVEFSGEAGELMNCVKKVHREQNDIVGSRVTTEDVKDELGDVFITLLNLSDVLGIDLEQAVIDKFNKTSEERGFKTKLQ